jgi:hypothetical protein
MRDCMLFCACVRVLPLSLRSIGSTCAAQRSPDALRKPNYGDSTTLNKYGDHKWGRAVGENGDRDLMPAVPNRRAASPSRRRSKGPTAYLDVTRAAHDPYAAYGYALEREPTSERGGSGGGGGGGGGGAPQAGELEVLLGYPKWLPPGVESVHVTAETDDGACDRSERMHMRHGVAWSGPEGRFGGALVLTCDRATKVTLHVMAQYAGDHSDAPPRSLGGTTLALPSSRRGSVAQRRTTKLTAPLEMAVQLVWNYTDGTWHHSSTRRLLSAPDRRPFDADDDSPSHTGEWRVDVEDPEPYGSRAPPPWPDEGDGHGRAGGPGGQAYLRPYDASERTAAGSWQREWEERREWDRDAPGHWPTNRTAEGFPPSPRRAASPQRRPFGRAEAPVMAPVAVHVPSPRRPSQYSDEPVHYSQERRRRESPRRDYSAHLLRRPPSPSPRPPSTTSYAYY